MRLLQELRQRISDLLRQLEELLSPPADDELVPVPVPVSDGRRRPGAEPRPH